MKTRALILMICLSLAAVAASAHGDEEHVMGTVTKITADAITVKTTASAPVTVAVVAATTFTKGKTAAKLADLGVGDRVVIHAKEPEEGKLVADTVQFTSKPAATHSTPAATPSH
jgi:hypothetical protein